MKMFCFPSAGSQASMFHGIEMELKDTFDVIPVEYPGHGADLGKSALDTMEELCLFSKDFIFNSMDTPNEEFIILGHSMGAMICYELAKTWDKSNSGLTSLILCGCHSPNFWLTYIDGIKEMNDKQFAGYLNKFGGIPDELMQNEFFWNIIWIYLEQILS